MSLQNVAGLANTKDGSSIHDDCKCSKHERRGDLHRTWQVMVKEKEERQKTGKTGCRLR